MKSKPFYSKLLLGLLLSLFVWWGTGNVYGQSNQALTEAQKIQMDNQAMQEEGAIVPVSEISESPRGVNFVDYVEIGTGTGFGTWPSYYGDFTNYWENARTQTLYLASELGGPKLITGLQYAFERIAAAPQNYLLNVEIRIWETTDAVLTTGAYYDASGATLVYSNANFVPATATGWANIIDIDDFVYDGVSNLIVEVLFGDNGYYNGTYFRTYRTDALATRMLLGYADSETPPNYDGASSYRSDIRFYYEDLPTVPGIEIINANLDMGDRPIGAWMKTAAFEIVNNPGEGDFLITEADIDEDFGGFLQVATPTLPYELAAG